MKRGDQLNFQTFFASCTLDTTPNPLQQLSSKWCRLRKATWSCQDEAVGLSPDFALQPNAAMNSSMPCGSLGSSRSVLQPLALSNTLAASFEHGSQPLELDVTPPCVCNVFVSYASRVSRPAKFRQSRNTSHLRRCTCDQRLFATTDATTTLGDWSLSSSFPQTVGVDFT